VLSGIAQQGAGSRGAESQMAQLMFDTGLGQERAGYASQAENAQAAGACRNYNRQMFESRFGVEQNRNTLAQSIGSNCCRINAGGSYQIIIITTIIITTIIDENNNGPLPGQLRADSDSARTCC
jgi:hypothetical protein